MSAESSKHPSDMKGNIALVMTIFSGIGSFGSLLLNWAVVSELSETAVFWFQGFAASTMLLAVIFLGMEWDLRRNKWHGIEDRYMQLDFMSSVPTPQYLPDTIHRMYIESLRKRKRIALSEGNQPLAEEFQALIDETKKLLKEAE